MTSFWQPKLTHRVSFIALLFCVSALGLLPDEKNNVEVYQQCNAAVVNITSVTLAQDSFFNIIPQKGVGSGAFIRPTGYILTNAHVVANARKLEVTLHDKITFQAKLVGSDLDTDLAVIKIDPRDYKIQSLSYDKDAKLQVGQKVLAIGNPFGLGGSLSVGVISSLERDIRTPTDHLMKNVIQTDAAINPGNSGGPLLDSSGNLIGINTQIVSASGTSSGVGFAISMKMAGKIADQLIEYGRVIRPELGMFGVGLGAGLLQALKVPIPYGVMVTELAGRGPSKLAGLRAANRELVMGFRRIPIGGDIVFRVDDVPVANMRDIVDYVFDKKEGESVVIHFYRNGQRKSVKVKLTVPGNGRGSGKRL